MNAERSDDAAVELLSDAHLAYQLERARQEAGGEFDEIPLMLTLLLHRVTALLVRASQFDFEPLQLTSTQFNVMTVLHRAESPMTMRELSESVSIRPPNLTTVVDSLKVRKLVTKKSSPHDRRSYLVSPTPQGNAVMSRFLPSHWRFMSEFYAGLSGDQREQLARLLDQLLASLRPDSDDAPAGLPQRVVDTALWFG